MICSILGLTEYFFKWSRGEGGQSCSTLSCIYRLGDTLTDSIFCVCCNWLKRSNVTLQSACCRFVLQISTSMRTFPAVCLHNVAVLCYYRRLSKKKRKEKKKTSPALAFSGSSTGFMLSRGSRCLHHLWSDLCLDSECLRLGGGRGGKLPSQPVRPAWTDGRTRDNQIQHRWVFFFANLFRRNLQSKKKNINIYIALGFLRCVFFELKKLAQLIPWMASGWPFL